VLFSRKCEDSNQISLTCAILYLLELNLLRGTKAGLKAAADEARTVARTIFIVDVLTKGG